MFYREWGKSGILGAYIRTCKRWKADERTDYTVVCVCKKLLRHFEVCTSVVEEKGVLGGGESVL